MANLDTEFKDKLRERVDLVTYIGRFFKVERSGANYKCCCPFHNEKTASFTIFPDQHYHCFGCGESGDIIKFVMKYENHDFLEAIKLLADLAGLQVPDQGFERDVEQQKNRQDKLLRLMREAALHYASNLKSGKAKQANEYLAKRNIEPALARHFGLGVALGRTDCIEHLRAKGFSNDDIIESSIGALYGGNVNDVFAERLIFPIINSYSNVVGFGGRRLNDDENVVKYYNSRATLIFDKSKTLYGINFLKKKKQVERGKQIVPILVEGYMDVLALHSAGFNSAVASLGTALTREQSRQLKFYGQDILICYDGDAAGKKATLRGLDILKADGFNVRVVDLPEGMDPDDAVRKKGTEFFKNCLEGAPSLLEFKLMCAKRENAQKADYARAAVAILAQEQDAIIQEEYLRRLESETGYMLDTLRRQMEKSEESPPPPPPQPIVSQERDEVILFLLNCWLKQKQFISLKQDLTAFMSQAHHRDLYYYLRECFKNGEKPLATRVYDIFGERGNEAGELIDYQIKGDEKKYYNECLQLLNKRAREAEKAVLSKQYKAIMNDLKKIVDESKRDELVNKTTELLTKMKWLDEEIRSGGNI